MEKVILNVPENVHIRISRFSPKAVDLKELVYSHVLLPVRANFGRYATFEWAQPTDWIKFCNGKEIQIIVIASGERIVGADTVHANVRHGEERVVYVKPVLAEVA